MNLTEVTDELTVYLSTVRGFSDATVTAYRDDYAKLKDFLGPETGIQDISLSDLRFCVAGLSRQKKAVASINRFIASVRSLFAYCHKFQYIKTNPALELKTLKMPKHLPVFMTETEVEDLCQAPDTKTLFWKSRDRAIFRMLYSSGCRVAELASLTLNDFSDGGRRAVVTGKGRKDRIVFFDLEARKALASYMAERKAILLRMKIPAGKQKFVFINQKGGALTVRGIRWIVERYSGPEGINHHVSPHAFRHTFATTMLNNGADVRVVQEMLGHSSISTTQRYTHITTRHLIDVYRQAHPHSGE